MHENTWKNTKMMFELQNGKVVAWIYSFRNMWMALNITVFFWKVVAFSLDSEVVHMSQVQTEILSVAEAVAVSSHYSTGNRQRIVH